MLPTLLLTGCLLSGERAQTTTLGNEDVYFYRLPCEQSGLVLPRLSATALEQTPTMPVGGLVALLDDPERWVFAHVALASLACPEFHRYAGRYRWMGLTFEERSIEPYQANISDRDGVREVWQGWSAGAKCPFEPEVEPIVCTGGG